MILREGGPIRLIEIPAIRSLEDKLLLGATLHGPLPHTLDAPIREASMRVFGVSKNDTYFKPPADFSSLEKDSAEYEKVHQAWWDYEDRFEIDDNFTDDEIVEALLRFGVDIRDERGFPLRSTKLLFRQAARLSSLIPANGPF